MWSAGTIIMGSAGTLMWSAGTIKWVLKKFRVSRDEEEKLGGQWSS